MMELSINPSFGGIRRFISLCKAHLSQRIALWVLMSILLIELIIVWPSYLVRQDELLGQLEQVAFTVALPIMRLTEAQITAAGQQVVMDEISARTVVLGQAMYSLNGETLNTFGEAPALTFAQVQGQDVCAC